MDSKLRSDVYAYLSEERLNVDVIFDWDDERGMLINARLRPWKNAANDGKMVLAAGLTVDDALLWAVRASLNNRWIPLNWRVRAQEVGIVKVLPGIAPIENARRSSLLARELFSETDEYDQSNGQDNGLENGSQKLAPRKKLVQKELPGIS